MISNGAFIALYNATGSYLFQPSESILKAVENLPYLSLRLFTCIAFLCDITCVNLP